MGEYRDPRIEPHDGDVLLRPGDVGQVMMVDEDADIVWFRSARGADMTLTVVGWRDFARRAIVLWQDDAPPPADVALASANLALAERVERAERMLLALAGEIDVNPWEYVVTSLGSVLGVESTADAVSAALRRLCGVSDG